MTLTIAVAGKGGTGKSSVAGLVIREMVKRGKHPILAVDSDPDANLHTYIGMKVFKSVGQVQQDWLKSRGEIPLGVSKQDYLMSTLNAAISEGQDIDLLTMGRPQGPGCYCSANVVCRDFVERLKPNYPVVVVDNEAGMEHISRRTIEDIDVLLMVADATPVGIRTAARLIELIKELDLGIPKIGLVLNRTNGELHPKIKETIDNLGVEVLGKIPVDPVLEEFSIEEKSLLNLPDDCPASKGIEQILNAIEVKSPV